MKKRWLWSCILFMSYTIAVGQQRQLFLIAGQSNAVGQGNRSESVVCAPETAFAFLTTADSLVPLADPFGEKAGHFEQANSGSMAPAFAREFYRLTGRVAVMLSAARGGASCHQRAELGNYGTWAETGHLPLLDEAVANTKRAMAKTRLPLQGIIWLQGERDANAIADSLLSGEDYARALTDVIRRFRKTLGNQVIVYIVQTGYQAGRTRAGSDAVRSAQESVAKLVPHTYIVYRETGDFAGRGWMKDFVHYNQAGLNDIGQKTARFISMHPD